MLEPKHLLELRKILESQISAITKMVGPKGDKGDTGAPGKAGAAGKAGKAGKDGTDGVCNCTPQTDELVELDVSQGSEGYYVRQGSQGTSELRTRLDRLEEVVNNIDTTAGDVTVVLPPAAGNAGYIQRTKKVAGVNNVILSAAEGIDGSTTATFGILYTCVAVQSDGTQWWII